LSISQTGSGTTGAYQGHGIFRGAKPCYARVAVFGPGSAAISANVCWSSGKFAERFAPAEARGILIRIEFDLPGQHRGLES